VFAVERLATALADEMAAALDDLDGAVNHVGSWPVHDPAWWGRTCGIGQQVAIPAFECDHESVEHIETGIVAAVFVA
jgi:hypothetical protein